MRNYTHGFQFVLLVLVFFTSTAKDTQRSDGLLSSPFPIDGSSTLVHAYNLRTDHRKGLVDVPGGREVEQ
jgi:hypothetical protein